MSRMRTVPLACCAPLFACFVVACGGGGGSGAGSSAAPPSAAPPPPPPARFSVSPTNIDWATSSPLAGTPFGQFVTTTVEGIDARQVFVRIVLTGTAVSEVPSFGLISTTQGRVSVDPKLATLLGPGTHVSALTFIACTTDPNCSGPQLAGSPATVNVTYRIGPMPSVPDAVAPSVGTAGVAGTVILRGTFVAFPIGSLPFVRVATFGTTLTTDISSFGLPPTELHVAYPALPPGTYPITLSDGSLNSPPIPFTGSLHIVDPNPLPAATLSYPSAPRSMRGLAFDARRQALIVGAGFSVPSGNQVLRYALSGGAWQAAHDSALPDLRDLILSLDGARVLAITDTSLAELDAATLSPLRTSVRPVTAVMPADAYLKTIVAANDGQALVLSGSSNPAQLLLYDMALRTFNPKGDTFFHPVAGGSTNGQRAFWFDSGLAGRSPAHQYLASLSQVTPTGPNVLQHFHPDPARVENINPPVLNVDGSRILVAGLDGDVFHGVFDSAFNELGRVPSSGTAAYVLASNGARAYVLELGTGVCRVRAFDLSAAPGAGSLFPENFAGFPIDLLPNCPASTNATPIRMLLSPPGNTLFIAGDRLIRVVQLP